jgi:flagellar assembly protein FliH
MSDAFNHLPWRPWALTDLSTPTLPPEPSEPSEPMDAAAKEEYEQMAALTAARKKLQAEAQRSGFEEGYKQGVQEGYQAGLRTGQEAGLQQVLDQQLPAVAQLQMLVNEFQHTLDSMDSVIVERLAQLALAAARKVLGQASIGEGTALIQQIQQFLLQEPAFSGKPQLRVHPSLIPLVEKHLGSTLNMHGWRLIPDPDVHPGGCKITAMEGDLDASLATRWHELCRLAAPGEL